MRITLKWQEICVPWICYHRPTNAIYTCNLYYQKRTLGHLKVGFGNMAIFFIFCSLIHAPPKTNHIAFSTFVEKWHMNLFLCYDIVVHVSHVAMISHSLTFKLSSPCTLCHLNMNGGGWITFKYKDPDFDTRLHSNTDVNSMQILCLYRSTVVYLWKALDCHARGFGPDLRSVFTSLDKLFCLHLSFSTHV